MKTLPIVLASTLLLGGSALAQQQYDSLGSPTPRPNQSASPNDKPPNIPVSPNDANASTNAAGAETTASGAGTSASSGANPATGGDNQPNDSDPAMATKNGATPSGITRE